NHLNTLCRQSVKRTVTELIHERIILEAKRQLAYTDWGVKKIADNIGFKDSSYFLRLFKKKTGITPDQLRANSNRVVSCFFGIQYLYSNSFACAYQRKFSLSSLLRWGSSDRVKNPSAFAVHLPLSREGVFR